MPQRRGAAASFDMLFDQRGRRKYLTAAERSRFFKAALNEAADVGSFCATIALTGCRLSEALELTWEQVDEEGCAIVLRSLKKRRADLYRPIPVPADLLSLIELVRHERDALPTSDELIWPWCRATGWKRIKEVMVAADIHGPHASPKGLRHSFGIAALQSGVPLTLVQRWLGHANIATTAIYTEAVGEEERQFAARFWRSTPFSTSGDAR